MSAQERIRRILDEVRGVVAQSNISDRDYRFVESLHERGVTNLSEKQEKWVADIEKKVFKEDGDDETG